MAKGRVHGSCPWDLAASGTLSITLSESGYGSGSCIVIIFLLLGNVRPGPERSNGIGSGAEAGGFWALDFAVRWHKPFVIHWEVKTQCSSPRLWRTSQDLSGVKNILSLRDVRIMKIMLSWRHMSESRIPSLIGVFSSEVQAVAPRSRYLVWMTR